MRTLHTKGLSGPARLIGTSFLFVLLCVMARGADGEPGKQEIECIGSFGERITAVAGQGNIVYTAGDYVVRAVDIRNPQKPKVIGWVRMQQPIINLAARGPAVYVGMSNGRGAWLVDASDPKHLRRVREIGGDNRGTHVEIMGDFLYIQSGGKWGPPSYSVLGITNPLDPAEVDGGSLRDYQYHSFLTDGKRLFAMRKENEGDGTVTLVVKDCTTKNARRILSRSFKYENTPGRLDLDLNTGKVWLGKPGLKDRAMVGAIDVSGHVWRMSCDETLGQIDYLSKGPWARRPRREDEKSNVDYGLIHGLAIEDLKVVDRVAYAVGERRLTVIDCHQPEMPAPIRGFDLPSTVSHCAMENDTVYAGGDGGRVYAVDVRKSAQPVLRGSVVLPKEPKAMAASGYQLFVADGEAGLQVINVSNPSAMKIMGSYATPEPCLDLVTSGTLVYALTQYRLYVLDTSGNGAPTLKHTLAYRSQDDESFEYNRYSIKRLGSTLYLIHCASSVGNMDTLVKVVDITDPMAPRMTDQSIHVGESVEFPEEAPSMSEDAPRKTDLKSKTAGWLLGLPTSSHSTDGTEWAMEFYDLADPMRPVYVDGYYSRSECRRPVLYKDVLYKQHDEGKGVMILRRNQRKAK